MADQKGKEKKRRRKKKNGSVNWKCDVRMKFDWVLVEEEMDLEDRNRGCVNPARTTGTNSRKQDLQQMKNKPSEMRRRTITVERSAAERSWWKNGRMMFQDNEKMRCSEMK